MGSDTVSWPGLLCAVVSLFMLLAALADAGLFLQAVGDELLDSIVSENIPIWTEEERYNQTVLSSVDRLEAQLTGQKVPGA